MKLIDFINNQLPIKDEDKLTTKNFWIFFEKIKKDKDIQITLNNHGHNFPFNFATHKLNNILKENSECNLFCIGGDVCIPPNKDEYLLYCSNQQNVSRGEQFIYVNYTDTLQQEQMDIEFKNKLEMSVYENIEKQKIRMFTTQVYLKHPNVFFIPLGIQLHGTPIVGQNFCDLNINLLEIKNKWNMNDKTITCYLNCSKDISKEGVNFLMGNIRELCYQSIENNQRPFITSEVNNIHRNQNKNDKFIYYYDTLCKSKFCFCPPNCVPDTYRIWDCLYMGCIPIVIDFEGSEILKDLPIFFIDSYKKYLTITEEELNNIWEEMIHKDYNYEKLSFSFWKTHIQSNML